jgi:hypothetical protein
MPIFVAIRHMPGLSADALKGAGARIKSCAAGMQTEGTEVRWLRSFFLAESDQTHCYFEAPTREAVADLNERAGLPYLWLLEAAQMTPDTV